MSYATGTTHYNLPVTTGSDKRDWSDTNQAFTDIDAALYGAVSDAADNTAAITALDTRLTTAESDISTNAGNITSLDTRLTTAEGAITSMSGRIDDVGNDLSDMICAYNEPTATSTHNYAVGEYFRYNDVLYRATQQIAIGDTIVPDTNCTTTNVTTELLSTEELSDDVTQLQTDVGQLQTAINQLNDHGVDIHVMANGVNDAATLASACKYIADTYPEYEYNKCYIRYRNSYMLGLSYLDSNVIGYGATTGFFYNNNHYTTILCIGASKSTGSISFDNNVDINDQSPAVVNATLLSNRQNGTVEVLHFR